MSILGLSAADAALYSASLNTDCDVAYQILNLNLSHGLIASIDPLLLDGQLDYTGGDTDGVTQLATMSFLDPDRTLRLDGTQPSAGVGGLDRLIQVRTYVRSDLTTGRWIGAYAFTGRPSKVDRDGDVIALTAESKECLHIRGVDQAYVEKGAWGIAAIKWILTLGGETRFRFPTVTAGTRLPSRVYYGGPEYPEPWKAAWKIARGMGFQLYYDKSGYACLRKYPQSAMWRVVEQGPGANALTRLKTSTDLTTVRNRVIVRGHTKAVKAKKGHPEKKSTLVTGLATAPWNHPLSAQYLVQNGKPWYNTIEFDESTVYTKAEADKFAEARLNELLLEQTSVETTIPPIWHADPMDLFAIDASNGAEFMIRLLNGSAPWGPSDTGMTVGYNQRTRRAAAGRLGR